MNIFAWMGIVSLYLVIATLVSRGIYSSVKGSKGDRVTCAAAGGMLFPITVPIVILVFWVYSILRIPLNEGYNETVEELDTCQEELKKEKDKVMDLKNKDVKSVFKVGDEITGVEGNPDGYNILYEGCVCRVLRVGGNKHMKLILTGHEDKEAHQNRFGETFTAPASNFRLVKVKSTTRKKK